MKHNIHHTGHAYSLRPIEFEDAEFIISTRTSERSRFMNQIERTLASQQKWLEEYFQRSNDYYFVVERNKDKRREGMVGIYDFDHSSNSAQWGRVILVPGSLAAAEAALLSFTVAFGTFDLSEVWGVVLSENKPMHGYVQSLGFERLAPVSLVLDGKEVEGIKYVLTKERWKNFENEISAMALIVADQQK
jgi:RimJ/RimL family protein N-acetyltransferase